MKWATPVLPAAEVDMQWRDKAGVVEWQMQHGGLSEKEGELIWDMLEEASRGTARHRTTEAGVVEVYVNCKPPRQGWVFK